MKKTKPAAPVGETLEDVVAKQSRIKETWHRLLQNKGAVIGMIVILLLILIALGTTFFLDYSTHVTKMVMVDRFHAPSAKYPFGTDDMGRNLLWRTLYGTRYSLLIGFGAVALSVVIGVILGGVAGYYGGAVDDVIMRISDVLASIPAILLGMCIMTVLGQSLPNLLIAVGVPGIPAFIRITRASVMTVRNQEYVEAARAIGMSDFRIIFTQVLPNGLSPIIVTVTTRLGSAINEGASLSFLGFGVPVPTPEWGALISTGRSFISQAPWISTIPGIFILVTVLSFNLLGDGLRDALDPKLKK